MDPVRYHTLKFLVEFFREVVAKEGKNKMTSYNISVTTGPAIIRARKTSMDDLQKHSTYYDALLKMIKFYHFVFDPHAKSIDLTESDGLRHGQVGAFRTGGGIS